jgi:hypothetical protein
MKKILLIALAVALAVALAAPAMAEIDVKVFGRYIRPLGNYSSGIPTDGISVMGPGVMGEVYLNIDSSPVIDESGYVSFPPVADFIEWGVENIGYFVHYDSDSGTTWLWCGIPDDIEGGFRIVGLQGNLDLVDESFNMGPYFGMGLAANLLNLLGTWSVGPFSTDYLDVTLSFLYHNQDSSVAYLTNYGFVEGWGSLQQAGGGCHCCPFDWEWQLAMGLQPSYGRLSRDLEDYMWPIGISYAQPFNLLDGNWLPQASLRVGIEYVPTWRNVNTRWSGMMGNTPIHGPFEISAPYSKNESTFASQGLFTAGGDLVVYRHKKVSGFLGVDFNLFFGKLPIDQDVLIGIGARGGITF